MTDRKYIELLSRITKKIGNLDPSSARGVSDRQILMEEVEKLNRDWLAARGLRRLQMQFLVLMSLLVFVVVCLVKGC